jgi:hypothetical protein
MTSNAIASFAQNLLTTGVTAYLGTSSLQYYVYRPYCHCAGVLLIAAFSGLSKALCPPSYVDRLTACTSTTCKSLESFPHAYHGTERCSEPHIKMIRYLLVSSTHGSRLTPHRKCPRRISSKFAPPPEARPTYCETHHVRHARTVLWTKCTL